MPKTHATDVISNDPCNGAFVEVALPLPIRKTFTYRNSSDVAMCPGARVLVPFGRRMLTGYVVGAVASIAEGLDISKIKEVEKILDSEPLITDEIFKLTKWSADYYSASWGEMLKASLPAGIDVSVKHIVSLTAVGRKMLSDSDDGDSNALRILRDLVAACEEGIDERELLARGGSASKKALSELRTAGAIVVSHRTGAGGVKERVRKAVRIVDSVLADLPKPLAGKQAAAITIVEDSGGEMLVADLAAMPEVGVSAVNTLVKKGILESFESEVMRDPLKDAKIPKRQKLELTQDQSAVLTEIVGAVQGGGYAAFLLDGVTGSGKTEVYIRAMQEALTLGRSSLMLVPEIALTPVFSRRLKSVFGDDVAILHSGLSMGERFDEWRRIRSGAARIVIGTRSAIFAPLVDVGLIIVDEEHDGSYRQQDAPFYSARDVAIVRAHFNNAVAVLGSATPSMESFHNALTGKYRRLALPQRVNARPMPSAEIIDMRGVFKSAGKETPLSPQLIEAIRETHAKGEQVMIFLNRRGYAPVLACAACGQSIKCPNCDITLTYHKKSRTLACHYCNHIQKTPDACPVCVGEYLHFIGEGTEQIEDQLAQLFPTMRIARIDRDTIQRKHELEDMLQRFGDGELDMLIGTQMIAKGHDFHRVTLVGVISVDAALGMPDFRSSERTFQLLTQVAGRAGRGELPGRVLIQTYHPEHYVITHACTQDYRSFFDAEIKFRERLGYPPFTSVASILIKHSRADHAMEQARIIARSLTRADSERRCRILGPAPSPLACLRGEQRVQILVKSKSRLALRDVLDRGLEAAEAEGCDMKTAVVEIDPISLL